jgi:uncharacterized protein (TIGR02145 family)
LTPGVISPSVKRSHEGDRQQLGEYGRQLARVRAGAVTTVLSVAVGFLGASCLARHSAEDATVSGAPSSLKRMPDGKQWTTANLNVNTDRSYCYDDVELNCRRYGRLYTWESAQQVCQSLGNGWRLPTTDEWRQLAKHYGGVSDDSDDRGKAAYAALLIGGSSGFNALLGGGRADGEEQYARLEAHGFYWTASESNPGSAWFYNFAKGGPALHRQREGEKQRAFSVRCVRSDG